MESFFDETRHNAHAIIGQSNMERLRTETSTFEVILKDGVLILNVLRIILLVSRVPALA